MEQHEFDIKIKPDGKVEVHIKGVKGPVCMEYAKLFERIIGKTETVEHTGEYYEPPSGVQVLVDQKVKD